MYESISKNNELENEMTLDMSYFWYSDMGRNRADSKAKGMLERAWKKSSTEWLWETELGCLFGGRSLVMGDFC